MIIKDSIVIDRYHLAYVTSDGETKWKHYIENSLYTRRDIFWLLKNLNIILGWFWEDR